MNDALKEFESLDLGLIDDDDDDDSVSAFDLDLSF
jgi:hypothetical protein